jgi:hypothetical protein
MYEDFQVTWEGSLYQDEYNCELSLSNLLQQGYHFPTFSFEFRLSDRNILQPQFYRMVP